MSGNDQSAPETPSIASNHRPSSFAAVPKHLYTPFIYNPGASFCTECVGYNLAKQTLSGPSPRAALLAYDYQTALLQAVAAILINHIRRTVTPWLGAFLFYEPMDDLRLARSNPDVFLEQTMSFSWTWAVWSLLQMYTVDILALLSIQALAANNGRLSKLHSSKIRGSSSKAARATLDGLMHLRRIGYGVYILLALDFFFCRTVHMVSCITALIKLLGGNEAGHQALKQVLLTHRIKVPVVILLVLQHIRYGMLPMLGGAVTSAIRGKPGLMVILVCMASGVAATIKWRARLYILLEMSPMFVVLGQVLAAAMLLATGAVDECIVRSYKADVPARHAAGVTEELSVGDSGGSSGRYASLKADMGREGNETMTRRRSCEVEKPLEIGIGSTRSTRR